MSNFKRHGNKWTINELLSLQREYELLEWTIQQISEKHQRSVEAILFKLESEGFIDEWSTSRGFDEYFHNNKYVEEEDEEEDEEFEDEDEDDEEDDEEFEDDDDEEFEEEEENDEVDNLIERVWNLETSIKEIGSIVKQIFKNMITNNAKGSSASKVYC